MPLALSDTGERLAKRDAAEGLAELRARGLTAPQIVGALAASAGLCPADTPATPRDLLATFTPARLRRAPGAIPL